MNTYAILRRSAWADAPELGAAAKESTRVGDEEMPNDVRWIRSYVLAESDDRLGTVCIYQGTSEEAVREHATRSGLACDEVIAIADTVIVRADP